MGKRPSDNQRFDLKTFVFKSQMYVEISSAYNGAKTFPIKFAHLT